MALFQQQGVKGPARAYQHIAALAPELRVLLKPLATHYTEAKTILATAHATLDLIRWILHGRTVEVSVQYQHRGENGFNGPLGTRVIVAGKVEQVLSLESYSSAEITLMQQSQQNIANKIRQWCGLS